MSVSIGVLPTSRTKNNCSITCERMKTSINISLIIFISLDERLDEDSHARVTIIINAYTERRDKDCLISKRYFVMEHNDFKWNLDNAQK